MLDGGPAVDEDVVAHRDRADLPEDDEGVTDLDDPVQPALDRRRDSATRCGATVSDGSVAIPSSWASSSPCSKGALLALICSSIDSEAKLTTNSPVSSTLRTVSLRPSELNSTIGGRPLATVKNECGARLPCPSASTVETQAIGRGTTSEVSSP